jgi:hypothetical protein
MLPSVQELERIFSIYPWTPDAIQRGFIPLLSPEVARERAEALHDDLTRSPFEWDIKPGFPTRDFQLPTYQIPGTHFGAEVGSGAADVQKAHGVGLNWGNPLKLAKVCSIARQHFGPDWMLQGRFSEKLHNGNHHLSFVEEFLWLGMWRSVTGVEPGKPPEYEVNPFSKAGSAKKIDWRFKSCDQVINLEVKYRPKDWMRHVDGAEFYLVRDDYYDDCEGKFPVRYDGELNLIGVSSPASIDRSWQLQTETFVRTHPDVDGVIMWAQDSQTSGVVFDVQSKQKALIDLLFTSTSEDKGHVAIVMHVWKERKGRREARAENIGRLIEEINDKNYQAFLDSVCGKDRQKP